VRTGKIPENVLKRSILKKIANKRSEILIGSGVGEDCACLSFCDDEDTVLSTNPVIGNIDAIHKVVNNIAASGAKPVGISVTILVPKDTEEEELKKIMDEVVAVTNELDLQIFGGHTEVTEAVIKPVLSITAAGKVKKGGFVSTKTAKPGDDIVVTKWIGLEGTAAIAKEKEEELLKKFPDRYIYDAKNFSKLLSVVPEAALAVKSGVTAMHDITRGGIFAALWELAESSGVGLITDLRKIPVKQETIEICNYFDINPYELASAGALLLTSEDGNRLVLELKEAGIEASVIGKITDSNDRVMINGENKRFLEPPKTDEIYKVL